MVRNQHYVPQFYLNKFMNNDLIYIYDINNQRQDKKRSVKHLCSKDYFYEIDDSSPTNITENQLRDIEDYIAKNFKDLIIRLDTTDSYQIALTINDMTSMLVFCIFQLFRTSKGLSIIESAISQGLPTFNVKLLGDTAKKLFQESREYDIAKLALSDVSWGFLEYLLSVNGVDTIQIFKGCCIWTSDSPIAVFNNFESLGFALSSKYYILLHFGNSVSTCNLNGIIRTSNVLYLQDGNNLKVKRVKLLQDPYRCFNKNSSIIIKSSKFTDSDIEYIKNNRGGN